MNTQIDQNALEQIFLEARSQNGWLPEAIPETTLRRLYEVVKNGPTSMNCQPMRLVFLTTDSAKKRLLPALLAGNVDKTRAAPVTVLIAYDTRFFDEMPRIWHNPAAREMFAGNAALAEITAFRNGSIQGGYLMLAARALGLDCGPMSGFDVAKVDAEFFPDGRFKANFLCNLGRGDPAKVMDRQPRFSFDDACLIV
jgi:3-hydroxypropanoate dehydrogenase